MSERARGRSSHVPPTTTIFSSEREGGKTKQELLGWRARERERVQQLIARGAGHQPHRHLRSSGGAAGEN